MAKIVLTKDDLAKAARRPIPKTTQAWFREVEGLQAFIDKLKALREDHGKEWVASMTRYNVARLAVLGKNHPPGLTRKSALAIVKTTIKLLT